MLDPKAPKLSQLPLGQRIGKSLRPLLSSTKRNMSTGTFYKAMKDKFASVMPEKMAKAAALRYAVGTDTGLTDKKEKLAIKQMAKADWLSSKYKDGSVYKTDMAMHDYQAAVAANEHHDAPSTEKIDPTLDPRIKRAKIQQAELHNKMQADHDAHLAMQGEKVGGQGAREDSATTSIARVPIGGKEESEPEAPILPLD